MCIKFIISKLIYKTKYKVHDIVRKGLLAILIVGKSYSVYLLLLSLS